MRKIIKTMKRWWSDDKKKRLFENYISLSVLQGANYLLPLITLPYLVRVLGIEKYGLVMFANAFIQYFIIFTDYGFNLSTTRDISINRDNFKTVSEIYSAVFLIKTILMLLGFAAIIPLIFFIKIFRENSLLFIFNYGIVIGRVYFPVWFFQGMERMRYISFLNILAKLIFTVLIFMFVHEKGDYLYIPLLNSIGQITEALLAIFIVYRQFNIRLTMPSWNLIKGQLRESFLFFISRVSVSLYTSSNTFVLGLFAGNRMTGYYASAEQIYKAMYGLFWPLISALYPFVSKERNVRLFKKIFVASVLGICLVSLIMLFSSDQVVNLAFGAVFEETSQLLKLFSILVVITVMSMLLGYPFLAALGYSKNANMSVVYGSILHFIMLIMIIPFINIYLVAGITMITESVVLMTRFYAIKKYNLWSLR